MTSLLASETEKELVRDVRGGMSACILLGEAGEGNRKELEQTSNASSFRQPEPRRTIKRRSSVHCMMVPCDTCSRCADELEEHGASTGLDEAEKDWVAGLEWKEATREPEMGRA